MCCWVDQLMAAMPVEARELSSEKPNKVPSDVNREYLPAPWEGERREVRPSDVV